MPADADSADGGQKTISVENMFSRFKMSTDISITLHDSCIVGDLSVIKNNVSHYALPV